MILGKQFCDLADRECDAQPAAIALNIPIPVILAVRLSLYFLPRRKRTREGGKEEKKMNISKKWNDAAGATAKPSCLFIANHHF